MSDFTRAAIGTGGSTTWWGRLTKLRMYEVKGKEKDPSTRAGKNVVRDHEGWEERSF